VIRKELSREDSTISYIAVGRWR